MDITDWRKKIDDLDRKLAALLNERASAAIEIGRLKRNTSLPIYEPEREREVIANVQRNSTGPLAERDLAQIYERIMDVMRTIQKNATVSEATPPQAPPPDSKLKVREASYERRKR
jgi:chorismate mutase